jgi:hypothetical protein
LIDKLKKKLASTNSGSSQPSTFLTGTTFGFEKKDNSNTTMNKNKLGPLTSISNKPNVETEPEKKPNSIFNKPAQISSKGFSAKEDTKKTENKPAAGSKNNNGFWDLDELGLDDKKDEVDYNNTNLNKLNKAELDKHKKKMDVLFNQNRKDKDDPDFVYDVQQDFEPHEDNEWDEDLEY